MSATFYGVGIGPGDPELLTCKAVRILTECPVLAAPQTHSEKNLALDIVRAAVDLGGKEILPLHFPMTRSEEQLAAAHRAAAQTIAARLDRGQDVVMPVLGDVSLYSTYCYVQALLKTRGYATVMIPGVPSFCAVAATLNTSLTTRDSRVIIEPACWQSGPDAQTTRIIMKSGHKLPAVVAGLTEEKKQGGLVLNCSLPDETVCPSLADYAGQTGYFATIIVKE